MSADNDELLFLGTERYLRHTFDKSSVVHFVSYDSLLKVLVVVFTTGATYEYVGVEQLWVEELIASTSPGKHLSSMVKGLKYQRVK